MSDFSIKNFKKGIDNRYTPMIYYRYKIKIVNGRS